MYLKLDSQVATRALGGDVPSVAERFGGDPEEGGLAQGGSKTEKLQELVLLICYSSWFYIVSICMRYGDLGRRMCGQIRSLTTWSMTSTITP